MDSPEQIKSELRETKRIALGESLLYRQYLRLINIIRQNRGMQVGIIATIVIGVGALSLEIQSKDTSTQINIHELKNVDAVDWMENHWDLAQLVIEHTVGSAEGNLPSKVGDKPNPAYYYHEDPGNHKPNFGFGSENNLDFQNVARQYRQADDQTKQLVQQKTNIRADDPSLSDDKKLGDALYTYFTNSAISSGDKREVSKALAIPQTADKIRLEKLKQLLPAIREEAKKRKIKVNLLAVATTIDLVDQFGAGGYTDSKGRYIPPTISDFLDRYAVAQKFTKDPDQAVFTARKNMCKVNGADLCGGLGGNNATPEEDAQRRHGQIVSVLTSLDGRKADGTKPHPLIPNPLGHKTSGKELRDNPSGVFEPYALIIKGTQKPLTTRAVDGRDNSIRGGILAHNDQAIDLNNSCIEYNACPIYSIFPGKIIAIENGFENNVTTEQWSTNWSEKGFPHGSWGNRVVIQIESKNIKGLEQFDGKTYHILHLDQHREGQIIMPNGQTKSLVVGQHIEIGDIIGGNLYGTGTGTGPHFSTAIGPSYDILRQKYGDKIKSYDGDFDIQLTGLIANYVITGDGASKINVKLSNGVEYNRGDAPGFRLPNFFGSQSPSPSESARPIESPSISPSTSASPETIITPTPKPDPKSQSPNSTKLERLRDSRNVRI